jgi:integrin beta 8
MSSVVPEAPSVLPPVAMPSVAVPSVAVPSVAVPSVAVPSVAVPSVAVPSVLPCLLLVEFFVIVSFPGGRLLSRNATENV